MDLILPNYQLRNLSNINIIVGRKASIGNPRTVALGKSREEKGSKTSFLTSIKNIQIKVL